MIPEARHTLTPHKNRPRNPAQRSIPRASRSESGRPGSAAAAAALSESVVPGGRDPGPGPTGRARARPRAVSMDFAGAWRGEIQMLLRSVLMSVLMATCLVSTARRFCVCSDNCEPPPRPPDFPLPLPSRTAPHEDRGIHGPLWVHAHIVIFFHLILHFIFVT